jgi:hypothetical protein
MAAQVEPGSVAALAIPRSQHDQDDDEHQEEGDAEQPH